MKKTIALLLALGSTSFASELIYTGASDGIANNAANWYDVETDATATAAPKNGDTLWIGYDTAKNESTPVTVKVDNTKTMNTNTVYIASGSVLKTTVNDWTAWATTFYLNSENALTITGTFYGNYKNPANVGFPDNSQTYKDLLWNPMTLNLGTDGSMLMTSSSINNTDKLYFQFNAEVYGNYGSEISKQSRLLMTIDNESAGNYTNILDGITSSLTLTSGQALTFVDSIDFNALTAEDVGKYTLSYEVLESGAYGVVAHYVTYIPEPATATLSLLALCGLAARRRRK